MNNKEQLTVTRIKELAAARATVLSFQQRNLRPIPSILRSIRGQCETLWMGWSTSCKRAL